MSTILVLTVLLLTPDAPRADVVIVVGAPGAPDYAPLFAEWSARWERAAELGNARATVIGSASSPLSKGEIGAVVDHLHARATPPNPPSERRDEVKTDRDRLKSALVDAAQVADRPLWLVLIGHGTFDRRTARFNLRGPDFSAQELGEWLKPLARPVAVIDCTAGSAPFMGAVTGPQRVVITATKGGAELNFARFGDFLSQSITDPAADLDKDDQVSLWEAFLSASRRTAEFYQTDGRLMTEHALLDDNGDGQGTRADEFVGLQPAPNVKDRADTLDGSVAHQWHLVPSDAEAALPPEIRARRNALELKIVALRQQKKDLNEDEYFDRLEALLIELARLSVSVENLKNR